MKFIIIAVLFLSAFHQARADEAPVTIQFNLCMSVAAADAALGAALADGKAKTTYIFESKDLVLYKNKVQIRLRLKKKGSTLSVKNFEVGSDVVSALQAKGASCEYDVHAGVKTGSCKYDLDISDDDAKSLIQGRATLSSLLTSDQIFLMNYLGAVSGSLGQVLTLGPVKDLSADFDVNGLSMSLDASITPKGTEYVQIKSVSDEANWQSQMQLVQSALLRKKAELCADQSGVRLRKFQDLLNQ